MSKQTEAIGRTSRLLVVFHLFQRCREVSFKEITDMLPVSQKTAYRDVLLLKRAGVLQIRYSKRQEAFVPVSLEFTQPEETENRTQKRRLEKLRRLCTLMVRLEEAEDPVAWYRETYPELSERTRQRDFQELGKIGYRIQYNPLHDPDRDWDSSYEPGWHCEFPAGTYDITF